MFFNKAINRAGYMCCVNLFYPSAAAAEKDLSQNVFKIFRGSSRKGFFARNEAISEFGGCILRYVLHTVLGTQ